MICKKTTLCLYGMGKSGQGVASFLNQKKISYQVLFHLDDLNTDKKNLIIKSPGILPFKILKNLKVISDFDLYFRIFPFKNYYLVSGTNGKTTVCSLLYEVLKNEDFSVLGNIGKSIFLEQNKNNIILEGSSFNLKYTNYLVPKIFILTSLFPHHLDYHENLNDYIWAKLHLLEQCSGSFIYEYGNKYVEEYLKSHSFLGDVYTFSLDDPLADGYIKEDVICFRGKKIMEVSSLKKQDASFLKNVLCVLIFLEILGFKNYEETIKNFKGLEHRAEIVEKNANFVIINDSKSTGVEACLSALSNALKFKKEIFLILGGKNGNEDFSLLNKYQRFIKKAFIYGENKQIIYDALNCENALFDNLDDVMKALNNEKWDDKTILFSPASASLDQFSSFEARGKYFKKLVKLYFMTKTNQETS